MYKVKEKITSIAELVEVAQCLTDIGKTIWWRGQQCSNPSWKLVPKIHRDSYRGNPDIERRLVLDFRSKAHTRHTNCPLQNDHAGWLFLMQHYRLPTRLLDWSESPLMALFFAVEETHDNSDRDGCLYALDPVRLNQQQGLDWVATAEDVAKFFAPPFDRDAPNPGHVAAVIATEIDNRMLIQLSQFTIHHSPTPLDELHKEPDYLVRFEIPYEAKRYLRDDLRLLGIREFNLFPDLEHLTKELRSKFESRT